MSEVQNTQAVESAPQVDKGLGFRGIYEVLISPKPFFEKLATQPRLLVVWLVFVAIIAVSFILMSDVIVEQQMEIIRTQNPEQYQAIMNQPGASDMVKYSTIIMGSLSLAIAPLLTAVLMLLFGNIVMGLRPAKYRLLLSIALYGSIIYGVGILVSSLMAVAKGEMTAGLSLAAVLPDANPLSFTWQALSKVSLFYIWEIIVVGIGLSAAYNVSRNKGILLSVLSVGLMMLIHLAWTAVGTAM